MGRTIPIVPNPIKTIREQNNLTQKAFASLAGVTDQVVVRNELGMYPELNPTIVRTCTALSSISPEQLAEQYELYILSCLANVKLPSHIPTAKELNSIDAMLKFRKDLTEANDMGNSSYSMCKLLKVHHYPLDRFLKGRKETAPSQIAERIQEIVSLRERIEEDNGVGGIRAS